MKQCNPSNDYHKKSKDFTPQICSHLLKDKTSMVIWKGQICVPFWSIGGQTLGHKLKFIKIQWRYNYQYMRVLFNPNFDTLKLSRYLD